MRYPFKQIAKTFYLYVCSGKELPPRVRRWQRRISLLIALIFPGLPQIFSKKRFFREGLLFFFGAGALFSLIDSFILSSVHGLKTFDVIYAIAVPLPYDEYPLYIHPTVIASENLTPIQPEGEPLGVQRFFREQWYICFTLYIACALISFWQKWKGRGKEVTKVTKVS